MKINSFRFCFFVLNLYQVLSKYIWATPNLFRQSAEMMRPKRYAWTLLKESAYTRFADFNIVHSTIVIVMFNLSHNRHKSLTRHFYLFFDYFYELSFSSAEGLLVVSDQLLGMGWLKYQARYIGCFHELHHQQRILQFLQLSLRQSIP